MSAKVKILKEAHYFPHREFLHGAEIHLKHFEEKHSGYHYSLLSSFLMSAFALEAFLNFVGPHVAEGWEDFDKCSTLGKLRHVLKVLGLKPDFSRRPYQTVKKLFSIRNKMAHPRDETLVEESVRSLEHYEKDFYSELRPKWMADVTESTARKCCDDVRKIMEEIRVALPDRKVVLTELLGGTSGSASVIGDE